MLTSLTLRDTEQSLADPLFVKRYPTILNPTDSVAVDSIAPSCAYCEGLGVNPLRKLGTSTPTRAEVPNSSSGAQCARANRSFGDVAKFNQDPYQAAVELPRCEE